MEKRELFHSRGNEMSTTLENNVELTQKPKWSCPVTPQRHPGHAAKGIESEHWRHLHQALGRTAHSGQDTTSAMCASADECMKTAW